MADSLQHLTASHNSTDARPAVAQGCRGLIDAQIHHVAACAHQRHRHTAWAQHQHADNVSLTSKFLQSTHLHISVQKMPPWKHSQYFFRQELFLQLQPLVWRTVPSGALRMLCGCVSPSAVCKDSIHQSSRQQGQITPRARADQAYCPDTCQSTAAHACEHCTS